DRDQIRIADKIHSAAQATLRNGKRWRERNLLDVAVDDCVYNVHHSIIGSDVKQASIRSKGSLYGQSISRQQNARGYLAANVVHQNAGQVRGHDVSLPVVG